MDNCIIRNKVAHKNLYNLILSSFLLYVVLRVLKVDIPTCITVLGDNILRITLIIIFCISNIYIIKNIMYFILTYKNIKISLIKEEMKKVLKELFKYFIFYNLVNIIISSFLIGIPKNSNVLNKLLNDMYIFALVYIIIIAPYLEETIFRYWLHNIMDNKYIYLIYTTFIFSAIHVLDDPNSLIYIWTYTPISFYLTYKYYKAQDLIVIVAIHSFHNILNII